MMKVMTRRGWSPYIAGGLVGVLLVMSVFLTGKYFGASTTFVRTAGMIEQAVAPEHAAGQEYYQKEKIKIEWQWMFVAGIFFGALAAAAFTKDFKSTPVPPMWESRFGSSKAKRWIAAFLGGIVLMFGARMADG
jgi:glycerol uptake facilitator-like aquaporin